MFKDVFSRRSRSTRQHRAAASRLRIAERNLSSLLEELENRRVLATFYQGVIPTNTTSGDETYDYQVNVTSGEVWIRYEKLQDRIDFDDNPGFGNVTNTVRPPSPIGSITPVPGPFSLDAVNVVRADWNTPGTLENFYSAALTIVCAPGAKVFVANGDALPLALRVVEQVAGNPASEVTVRGPVDSTLNAWSSGYANLFEADTITLQAETRTATGTRLWANSGVSLQNTITSPRTDAYVASGNFNLIAGASISGNVGIYLGQAGVGTGFSGSGGNIRIDGSISGSSISLNVNSASKPVSIETGPSGLLSGNDSLTLFNSGLDGGKIDVRSAGFAVTNVSAGSPSGIVPDIGVAINQTTGNLRVRAVPTSRGQISLTSSGPNSTITVDSNIETQAGLSLDAGLLDINSPIRTTAGNIVLKGDTVTVGSNVTAGTSGVGNVLVTSRVGGITMSSAAVVAATGESIIVDAKTNISSQARLEAQFLDLKAGGSITVKSNADEVRAQAASGITVEDGDSLLVRSAITSTGPVSISAIGGLEAAAIAANGSGAVTLTAGAGLLAKDVRAKNGSAALSAAAGDVRVTGTVTVEGGSNDLTLSAATGDVIIDSTAIVTVADQVTLSAPKGRALTPGSISAVVIDNPGAGYTAPTTVEFAAGGGATAAPVIATGAVSGLQLVSGGSGYVTAPMVTLVGGGGSNATAQAFISNGSVVRLLVTNPGIGYTSAPTVIFSGGSGSGAQAMAMINGVSSIALGSTPSGSGYLVPPDVVISSGSGAIVAPISVNSSGGITAINLAYPGSDFGVAPLVEITDSSGAGFGAAATARLDKGVTSFQITDQGSGYTGVPNVDIHAPTTVGGIKAEAIALISGSVASVTGGTGGTNYSTGVRAVFSGTGTGAAARVSISGSVNAVTITDGGGNYSTSAIPTVTFDSPAAGVTATGTPLLGLTNNSFQVSNPGTPGNPSATYSRAPTPVISLPTAPGGRRATATATLGPTGLVSGIVITDPGAGYTTTPTVLWTGGTQITAGQLPQVSFIDGTMTLTDITLTNPGSGYTTDPGVTISGNGGAQARATIRGSITGLTLTAGGSGYSAKPTVTIEDAFGSGATAVNTELDARVIGLTIVNPGRGYTSAPLITIDSPGTGGQIATATVGLSNVVAGFTIQAAGQNYNPATTIIKLTPVAGGGGAVVGSVAVNADGAITSIYRATGGEDYVAPPTVVITDTSGGGSGATATAVIDLDSTSPTFRQVLRYQITNPGGGYNPETTTVTVRSAGNGATAVANLDANGSVASVTVTNSGSGYQSGAGAPVVRFVPYGRAAAGSVTLTASGSIQGVTITDGGSNYAAPPAVRFVGAGGSGSGATGTAVISNIASVNALRLNVTATHAPLDALVSKFNTIALQLTAPGNITFARSTGTLVVEGASTTDGSIDISAPILRIAGPTRVGDLNGSGNESIILRATGGDLTIDAAVGSLLDGAIVPTPLAKTVTLSAVAGAIRSSNGGSPGLVTTSAIVFDALTGAILNTDTDTIRGSTSAVAANVTVTQTTAVVSGNVRPLTVGTAAGALAANDGTVTVTAGGLLYVGLVQAGSKGSAILTATSSLLDAPGDATSPLADIIAAQATLSSTLSQIDVDVSVANITASAPAGTIDIDSTTAEVLQATSVTARNGVRLSSVGGIKAVAVNATNGPVQLATSAISSNIEVGAVTAAGGFTATLEAGGSIFQTSSATAAIRASDALLTANSGKLDLYLDVATVRAIAPDEITLRDDTGYSIQTARSSAGKTITLNVGGTLSQTGPIQTGGGLVVNATGGEVSLSNAANDVGTLTARNPGRGIEFRDANALTIVPAGALPGIEGGAVNLTVGGPLTQTGSVTASSLTITSTAGGPIAFNNSANDVDTISIVNIGNDISFTDRDDVALKMFTGSNVTINAGGAITQPADGAITTSGLFTVNFTGAKQPITLGGLNDLVRFRIDNGTQPVTLNDINGLTVDSIVAGAVTLTVGGTLNQTGAIVTPSLTTSSKGGEIVLNAANDVGTLSASNPGRGITFRDANGLNIAALTGGAVNLAVGGNLTQSGAISTTALRVDASAGDIVLSNAANNVGTIAGTNPGRGFTLANNGTLTQSAGVVAGTLNVSNNAGEVFLIAGNDVSNLSIVNGDRAVRFSDSNGVNVTGLTGGNVQVSVGGSLTQTGRIASMDLSVIGAGGSVMLTREDNAVGGVFTANNPSGSVSFFNASGVRAGRVVAAGAGQFNGNVHLKAVNGGIQLTDDVFALDDTVKLEARNGTITQATGKSIYANSVVWFAQAAPALSTTATQVGQNLTLPGATLPPIVNNSFGTITIYDNSAMQGDIVVTAPNAAKVIIAGALTAGPGGKIDLRGINPGAVIEMRGDGDLQGTQVLVRSAATTLTWIVSGASASDAGTSLFNVVNRANSVMPKLVTQAVTTARRRTARTAPRAQPTRMSTISAEASTIDVQQSLPVLNVPVTFVTPTTIIAGGNAVSGSGLRLAAGASGSRLSNLAFQGFSGTGVELDRVQKATVQGVQVNGGTTGISVAGLSTGTRILGSTFRNVQTGLSLTSASRLTFGGRRAGEANRIENAAREGVFATGFATGTQLIKTQFVGGSSAIVTRNVRGLRIIR